MRRTVRLAAFLCLLAAPAAAGGAGERILMASSPALSPDGAALAFAWHGDLYVVSREGGVAEPLTRHPAADSEPCFSPDGSEIAFVSQRNGFRQVFVMPSGGGDPTPVTHDTDGATLHGWFPDGESLLVTLPTDRHWRRNGRFFRVPVRRRAAPEMLFDAYGNDASLSPDGTKLLFTREGVAWWRKGYSGSQASQVWLFDLAGGSFRKVLAPATGARWPRWLPDGRSFLFVVRYNGGGFTADHLLTALTQPVHAITVPRGGGPGYPQDRKVYATWTKPIVVLVNQSSFSNAEIFAHAIRTLGRGELVGVPTAGGVISTGRRRIMDVGFLRTPGRGWFVLGTGEDMERNGAVPHHVVWPEPGEIPAGVDRQLDKAVEVLLGEARAFRARPGPKLRRASER